MTSGSRSRISVQRSLIRRAGTIQFAIIDHCAAGSSRGQQGWSQVCEVRKGGGEEPGSKALGGASDTFTIALPDDGAAFAIGPDGDDARGFVPAKQPLV